jgi:hypothetical protein
VNNRVVALPVLFSFVTNIQLRGGDEQLNITETEKFTAEMGRMRVKNA